MKTRLQSRRQAAFTLIEVMLAIAIVLVLAAILMVAINKVFSTAKLTLVADEVHQLDLGVKNFQTAYNFYPPSRLKLCERLSDYDTTKQLDVDSVAFLTRMFPKIQDPINGPWTGANPGGTPGTGFIDWNGDGSYTATPPLILEGDQCLVFFLGGMPKQLTTNPVQFGMLGFSQNPYNPWLAPSTQGEVRISFFDFSKYAARLKIATTTATSLTNRSTVNPSLTDAYGQQPYLYFSSYKTADGYFRYQLDGSLADATYDSVNDTWATATSDCPTYNPPTGNAGPPTVKPGVWPYVTAVDSTTGYVHFANPNTFQILGAGKDGLWGSGTNTLNKTNNPKWYSHLYPPPDTVYRSPIDPQINAWADDLSNFTNGILQGK